jgi:hypothetical protein
MISSNDEIISQIFLLECQMINSEKSTMLEL